MTSADEFHDRRSGRGDRAGAAGAVAETHEVAVVLLQRDPLKGHAELRRGCLGERRRMTLAVIERPGGQLHRTVRLEGDLAEFAARRRADFEIGADRNPAELAVLAAFLLAFGEISMIGNLKRLVEYAVEIAAIIGDARRRQRKGNCAGLIKLRLRWVSRSMPISLAARSIRRSMNGLLPARAVRRRDRRPSVSCWSAPS